MSGPTQSPRSGRHACVEGSPANHRERCGAACSHTRSLLHTSTRIAPAPTPGPNARSRLLAAASAHLSCRPPTGGRCG